MELDPYQLAIDLLLESLSHSAQIVRIAIVHALLVTCHEWHHCAFEERTLFIALRQHWRDLKQCAGIVLHMF